MAGTWFDAFRRSMNVLFTEEDFAAYSEMMKSELWWYEKYLRTGARILDVGCGLGCASVPLSREGYHLIGIDSDPKVIEAARENGKRFGGTIEFLLMDAFDIDSSFGRDSFDACIHGGVLEHFSKEQIRILVDKQLLVASLILCSMPVRTRRTLKHFKVKRLGSAEVCVDGLHRNLWTRDQWIGDILGGYRIAESRTSTAIHRIGDFDELLLVIKR